MKKPRLLLSIILINFAILLLVIALLPLDTNGYSYPTSLSFLKWFFMRDRWDIFGLIALALLPFSAAIFVILKPCGMNK